jgi:hypothetical protein
MVYNSVNGVNKVIVFNNKTEYLNYFEEKFNFQKEKMYFPKKEEYSRLMNYFSDQKVSYFYGITVNEKNKINDANLNDNNSCLGRIEELINNLDSKHELIETEIAKFDFENINNERINFNKGKSIIFIISTKLGKAITNDIKELTTVIDNSTDKSINYYLISVDNQD